MNRRGIENTLIYGASHVLEKASKNSWVNWPRVVAGVKIKRGFVHCKSVVSKSDVDIELSASGVSYIQGQQQPRGDAGQPLQIFSVSRSAVASPIPLAVTDIRIIKVDKPNKIPIGMFLFSTWFMRDVSR
tara:strand:+ start:162 stop:551 length:390 start_codon:yes stop_codon:yes gene_type:complete